MALFNIVNSVTTTLGTADVVLGAAVAGYKDWSGIPNGTVVSYGLREKDSSGALTQSEVGTGTWNSSTLTLSRDTVLSSTNGGAKIVLATGTAEVYITALAEDFHNPVTIGTASGLSLATQVLSLGLASAGVTGALSGTDWSTFNSKLSSITGLNHSALAQLDYASSGHTGFQAALGYTPLNPANNLSDVSNVSTARTNLGLVIGTDVQAPLPVVDTQTIVKGSADATKLLRFEVDGFTTGTTRVLTPPNADATIAGLEVANVFTAAQTINIANSVVNLDDIFSPGITLDSIFTAEREYTGAATFTYIDAISTFMIANPSANTGAFFNGAGFQVVVPDDNSKNIQGITGLWGRVKHKGSGNLTQALGLNFVASNEGSGNVQYLAGVEQTVSHSGSGEAATIYGIYDYVEHYGGGVTDELYGEHIDTWIGGVATTAYGLRIGLQDDGATTTNAYGLYIDTVDPGATNYAIYTNAGLVRFGDNLIVNASAAIGPTATINFVPFGFTTTDTILTLKKEFTVGHVAATTENYGKLGIVSVVEANPSSSAIDTNYIGLYFRTESESGNTNGIKSLKGIIGYVFHNGDGNVNNLMGNDINVGYYGAGNIAYEYGSYVYVDHYGSGIVSNFYGAHYDLWVGGVASTAYGIRIDLQDDGATATNAYGLYVGNVDLATTNYAIYTEAGAVRFGGALTLANYTTNGFLKTSGGNGTISIDTTSYQTALGYIPLNPANNLSDVASIATARTNLGLAAGGAGDIWVEKAGDSMTGNLGILAATPLAPLHVNAVAAVNQPAMLVTDGLSSLSDLLLNSYSSVLTVVVVNGIYDYQILYINEDIGKVANYVGGLAANLFFDNYDMSGNWQGSNILISYGGYQFYSANGGNELGIYERSASVIGIGRANNLVNPLSNVTPIVLIDTATPTLTVNGKTFVDGVADAVQLRVQAHSTQTTNLQTWENSSSTVVASMSGTGALSLTAAPSIVINDAATSTATDLLILTHTTSGTPAVGFGSQILWRLESENGTLRDVGMIVTDWLVAAEATKVGRIQMGVDSSFQFSMTKKGVNFNASAAANGDTMFGVQDSGTAYFRVTKNSANGHATVFQTASSAQPGLVVKQGSSATGNLQEWRNSGDTALASISATGVLMIDGTSNQIQLRVQGHSTQSAKLQTFENSSGTVLASFATSGTILEIEHVTSGASQRGVQAQTTIGGNHASAWGLAGRIAFQAITISQVNEFSPSALTSYLQLGAAAFTASQVNGWTITGTQTGGTVTDLVYAFVADIAKSSGTRTNQYGIKINDLLNAATINRAIETNAGDVVFNNGGHTSGDFTWKTDSYNGIFGDASNESIVIMSNAAGKVGFYGATAIAQPTTGIAEATFVENAGGTAVNVDSTFDGYTMQQVVKALRNIGVLA